MAEYDPTAPWLVQSQLSALHKTGPMDGNVNTIFFVWYFDDLMVITHA